MITYYDQNALKLCHRYWQSRLQPGMVIVDATAGRGRDTQLLCEAVGETGHVYAFDIQPEALESTRERLAAHGLSDRATLILDSHRNLRQYVEKADAVVFNLGYLPGGDHAVGTHAAESIPAIEEALAVIPEEGFVTVCLYYGGDSGFAERDALMEFFAALDHKRCTVMMQQFYNRPNCPPILIIIERNH